MKETIKKTESEKLSEYLKGLCKIIAKIDKNERYWQQRLAMQLFWYAKKSEFPRFGTFEIAWKHVHKQMEILNWPADYKDPIWECEFDADPYAPLIIEKNGEPYELLSKSRIVHD